MCERCVRAPQVDGWLAESEVICLPQTYLHTAASLDQKKKKKQGRAGCSVVSCFFDDSSAQTRQEEIFEKKFPEKSKRFTKSRDGGMRSRNQGIQTGTK